MDFLKKGEAMMGGQGNNTNQQAPQGGAAPAQGTNNAGQEDYGDKGLDFAEKKTGHVMDRNTNEKITDGARGAYEKMTGKTVNPKYSN